MEKNVHGVSHGRDLFRLNRDQIKYIVTAAMVCNHAARVFLAEGTLLYELLVGIGYATAITMCFFLVEGFHYTRSRKAYAIRLFVAGIAAQVPYSLVITRGEQLFTFRWNMMFTLLLCLGILSVLDAALPRECKAAFILLAFFCSSVCDWGLLAPAFVLFFAMGGRTGRAKACASALLLFLAADFFGMLEGNTLRNALQFTLLDMTGPLLSAFLILRCYNGRKNASPPEERTQKDLGGYPSGKPIRKRPSRRKAFSKWFFYVFYPAHLLVLGMIGRVLYLG